jgi:hypothetical protein
MGNGDYGLGRSVFRNEPSGLACPSTAENGCCFSLMGDETCGMSNGFRGGNAVGGRKRYEGSPSKKSVLRYLGSFCQNFDCLDGMSAYGAFLGKHQSIGTIEHCVSNIGDFCTAGSRVFDHRAEHLRRCHHGFGGLDRFGNQFLLDVRHLSNRNFYTEVAAGHHDGISNSKNFVDNVQRFELLDFGH